MNIDANPGFSSKRYLLETGIYYRWRIRGDARDEYTVFGHLDSSDKKMDLYKGFSGGFRPWSRQLRQPILLQIHNAVISIAPIEGYMHRVNDLDTLGLDRPESGCN